jgi:hypothetical protein
MSLTWVRCHRWRILRWSLFTLALTALAWGLHAWLPAAPRWVVRGAFIPQGLTADGAAFQTIIVRNEDLPNRNRSPSLLSLPRGGPVQFWDVNTGQFLRGVLDDSGPRWHIALSKDGKRLVAVGPRAENAVEEDVRCLDVVTGNEARTIIPHRTDQWQISFSPGGDLLVFEDYGDFANETTTLFVYDATSLRLLARPATPTYYPRWLWSHDGQAALTYSTTPEGDGTLHRIGTNGVSDTRLTGAGEWLAITPDGKTLLTEPPQGIRPAHGVIDSILVWDIATGKQRGKIPVDAFHPQAADNITIFPDSRTVIVTRGDPRPGDVLSVWDLQAEQWLGRVQLHGAPVTFLPTRNAFAVWQGSAVTAYRARPFEQLWEHGWAGKRLLVGNAMPDAGFVIAAIGEHDEASSRVKLLDINSGATHLELTLQPKHHPFWLPRCDRFLVLEERHGEPAEGGALWKLLEHVASVFLPRPRPRVPTPTTTRVIDTTTGDELGRVALADANVQDVSADGRLLFMYLEPDATGEATLLCYDIPPRRDWLRIAGLPVVLGIVLVGLRLTWRRMRHRPA